MDTNKIFIDMAQRAHEFAEMCRIMQKIPDMPLTAEVKDALDEYAKRLGLPKADPEAWREEYRKKQAAGVRFEKIGQGGLVWLPFVGGFENGNKEDYREVPQESVAPQDDQFAPTSEDGHDCEGFPGGCNRFGCPGGDKCYMLNNQTPHAAERALWKAQREAGTNEVGQVKPKTVKYYFALIRNKFGAVDSLAASSMISFNRIAEKNSYIIIGDIEEREIEA